MPTIKETLEQKIKDLMRARDAQTLEFARSLKAAIRKIEVDDRVELDDVGVIAVIQKSLKQLAESIAQAKSLKRDDAVVKAEAEKAFLEAFLPPMMSEADLKALIQATIAEIGAKGAADLGKLMKAVMPKVQGKADGKKVNELAKQLLG